MISFCHGKHRPDSFSSKNHQNHSRINVLYESCFVQFISAAAAAVSVVAISCNLPKNSVFRWNHPQFVSPRVRWARTAYTIYVEQNDNGIKSVFLFGYHSWCCLLLIVVYLVPSTGWCFPFRSLFTFDI